MGKAKTLAQRRADKTTRAKSMQRQNGRVVRSRYISPKRGYSKPTYYRPVFKRGASMVGTRRPRQLLMFRPTKEMRKHGYVSLDLRFYHRKIARGLGLETRGDWIKQTTRELKKLGLL